VAVSFRLVLNPIKCVGHGMCAELFPERITLDDWGYPMIDPKPIPANLEDHARRAVAVCPTLALVLEREDRKASAPVRQKGRAG
jgi:ferredoxin